MAKRYRAMSTARVNITDRRKWMGSLTRQNHLAHSDALLSRARFGHQVQQRFRLSDLGAIVLPFAMRFHQRIVILLDTECLRVQEVNQRAFLAGNFQGHGLKALKRSIRLRMAVLNTWHEFSWWHRDVLKALDKLVNSWRVVKPLAFVVVCRKPCVNGVFRRIWRLGND